MKQLLKISTLVFILFLVITSCTKKPKKEEILPVVNIMTVGTEAAPIFIDTLGHFVAFNTVKIQAQVEGLLEQLFFEEGQAVHSGDLLFTIDPRPYQAKLDQAIATLKQNEANLEFAADRVARFFPLVQEDFVSQLDFDQYLSDLALYEAIIEENLAEIDLAAINLNYCTIASPLEGVTGKRLVDPGNLITNAGTDLLVINQVAPLFVDFSVPERYFDTIQKYQKKQDLCIEITVPNTDLKTVGRLVLIDNTVNNTTGMIALRGLLNNDDTIYWPGQFVRVRLILYVEDHAILLPNEAISPGNKGSFAWKISEDGTVEPEYLSLGERYQEKTFVTSGLKVGDKVVTKGKLNLKPGKKVKIVPAKSTSSSETNVAHAAKGKG